MKLINQLPTRPEWQYELVCIRGDVGREASNAAVDEGKVQDNEPESKGASEELELWLRDPVACMQELIGNAVFRNKIAYAPEKVYTDSGAQTWCYDKMWTSNWWWKTQVGLCEMPCQ